VYNAEKNDPVLLTKDTGCHLVSPLLIWIEQYLNNVRFQKRHLSVVWFVGGAYGIVNCICTFVRGAPMYPPINWVSVESYVFLGVSLVVATFGFYLGIWLTKLKSKRVPKEVKVPKSVRAGSYQTMA